MHRLPKGYGHRELEPHDPKAIGSRGHYKFARKVSPALRVSVGRFLFINQKNKPMDEEEIQEMERLALLVSEYADRVRKAIRLGQRGFSEAHVMYSDSIKVLAYIRALKAQGVLPTE